jgi:single-strand DNA-binding protein
MANEPTTTVIGNLTADPELRFTPTGRAVASFTIANTPRYPDKATGQWKDAETWFVRCSAWGDLGENIAASLTRGASVVAVGRLAYRGWETKEGEKRGAVELTVDDIGPSLRRAAAKVTKVTREHAPGAETARVPATAGAGTANGTDPWASDEPPF